ncbi:redoxin domain-containing protein [bacterium]|nr:redoxin domain-containing protein [bacterium]
MRNGLLGVFGAMLILIGTSASAEAVEANGASPVGKKIEPFRLQDHLGAWHSLADIPADHVVVVAFLGTECPLAKLYGPRLAKLAEELKDKPIRFLAIDANRQDSISKMAHYAKTSELNFPLLKDVGNQVADAFDAVRTPEVFVLDRDRIVRYHGRVDDQYGVGYIRPESNRADLRIAIDELLEGKSVSVASTPAPGCFIGRVRSSTNGSDVTYTKQISRILQQRCVECHREGAIAPFALTNYEDAAGWAETVLEVIQAQRMPPWHASPEHGDFINDARMPDAEKELVAAWVKAGMPEGNPKDLPEPAKFAEGWRIAKPDLVCEMNQDYAVPAEGEVPYQYFVMDPQLTEDKWVTAAECIAGNPTVVHHIIAFVIPPEVAKEVAVGHFSIDDRRSGMQRMRGGSDNSGRRQRPKIVDDNPNAEAKTDGTRPRPTMPANVNSRIALMRSWFTNFLVAMAPGSPPMILNDGMAKRLPAGCKIVFQSHYTPVGKAAMDRSKIGLVFVSADKVKHEVVTRSVMEQRFEIPPYDGNYEVRGTVRFRDDSLLIEFLPHMHLRGKSFRYVAHYPDGKEEILLDVPRYDFGWQNTYTNRVAKVMPRGTVLECIAHFDNSTENLSNPDPSSSVRFGDQTWEEMMIGFFNMSLAKEGFYRDPTKPRSAQFIAAQQAGEVTISALIRDRAKKAFESDEAFDLLWDEVAHQVPQIDRMDIGVADGLSFRFGMVAQAAEIPSSLKMKEFPKQMAAMGPALGLYQYAIKREKVVNNEIGQAKGVEMQFLARILPSSVHLPIRFQGKPACVNFWSSDVQAFSPEAVAYLEEIVRLMVEPSEQARASK